MKKYKLLCIAGIASLLAACSHTPAPVEDLSASNKQPRARSTADGNYTVRGGDTLYSIAFDFGLDWKDLASWNGIDRPYTIYPGQALRMAAPAPSTRTTAAVTTRPVGSAPTASTRSTQPETPRSTTVDAPPAASTTASSTAPGVPAQSTPPATTTTTTASTPAPTASPEPVTPPRATEAPKGSLSDPQSWLWPTDGRVVATFKDNDPSRKGLDIAGEEGQPIIASATGDVVYSGNGLIGFGELIIIKHSESMLTAYAHNRRRLVEEGTRVAAGTTIAEMGQNGQNQTVLHFELRVNGKPVDPMRYLPSR